VVQVRSPQGSKTCSGVSVVGFTSVTCLLPSGAGTNWLIVDVPGSGNSLSGSVLFTYSAPEMTSIAPGVNARPTSGGFTLTIAGRNLGSSDYASSLQIYVGDSVCDGAFVIADHTTVGCKVKPGTGKPL
jgi:hypothetical protein